MAHSLLIAGPTGLIGSTAVQVALNDPRVERVIALTRRKLNIADPGLEQWTATSDDLLAALKSERIDAVICCLGTTMNNVGGDKARFIHVDKDLVVGLAHWARAQGTSTFCVVSAVGADAASRVFYNRVKGEMEDALKALTFPTLHIFHPSILTGPRKEQRIGERIGIAVMSAVAPLLPMRYRPMPHDVLAKALVNATWERTGGTHTTAAIRTLAAKS